MANKPKNVVSGFVLLSWWLLYNLCIKTVFLSESQAVPRIVQGKME